MSRRSTLHGNAFSFDLYQMFWKHFAFPHFLLLLIMQNRFNIYIYIYNFFDLIQFSFTRILRANLADDKLTIRMLLESREKQICFALHF